MIYQVKVTPGAKSEAVLVENDQIIIKTTKRPHDGEANTAVINLLAKHFHTAKSNITIIKGTKSRQKLVEIQ